MKTQQYLEYRVKLFKDKETGLVVAEVPALGIADDGADNSEALANLQQMVVFHLECLVGEGGPIPPEKHQEEGLYLHVKLPAGAP